MITVPTTHLLAAAAYQVDRGCRDELANKTLVNEPDYVSNLTKGIRDYWKQAGLPAFAHSQVLPGPQESLFGCDAVIVIRYKAKAKVCLFEAKWPRLLTPSQGWDSIQKSSKISHFSDQLGRQNKWVSQAAIWELFMLEQPVGKAPKNFDSWGSTCIWHRDAYPYDNTYRSKANTWSDQDLTGLAAFATSKPKNILAMLRQAAQCTVGEYLKVTNGFVTLIADDGEEEIAVPASIESVDGPDINVASFMEATGLQHFLYIQLSEEAV